MSKKHRRRRMEACRCLGASMAFSRRCLPAPFFTMKVYDIEKYGDLQGKREGGKLCLLCCSACSSKESGVDELRRFSRLQFRK